MSMDYPSINEKNPSAPYPSDYAPPPYSAAPTNNTDSFMITSSSSYQPAQQQLSREQIFLNVIQKYEISKEYADRLQQLQGFKIVFIFDDSSSMNTTLDDSPLNSSNTILKATRWNELEYFANIALEIANLFDQSGSDVYFLNKPPVKNITNVQQFNSFFKQSRPNGYTPLTNTLATVLADNSNVVKQEKKLLIIIVTDGEPTDTYGNNDISGFKRCLLSRNPIDRIFTNIVACTDDDESISYLNKWDRKIKHLDVVDDYRNERKEVTKIKGSRFRFSYGDYVVKSLIGSIDPELDKFDERSSGCCIIS